MGQITNGVVKYGRTLNLGDYNSKRADVEIAFAASDDGSDYQKMTDLAATTAIAKVHELLALAEKPVARTATAPAPAAAEQPAGKTKAELEAEAAAKVGAGKPAKETKAAAKKPPVTPPAQAEDPAAVVEPAAAATTAAKSEDTAESLDDLLGAEEPPVTDEDLTSAITRKNAAIKAPQAIRQLIGKYVAPPGQARQIEAGKRRAFLAELDKLQPAAS